MEGEVVSKPRSFSNSMISTWRDCQALGFVEYVERIKLPRSLTTRLGTLTHAAVAADLRSYAASLGIDPGGEIDRVKAIRASLAEDTYEPDREGRRTAEEDAELALELTTRVARQLDLKSGRFEPVLVNGKLAVEQKIRLPVDDAEVMAFFDGGFVFVADWLCRDREYDNRLALVDFKVSKYIDQDFELDTQLALYQHALGTMGLWPELAWQYRVRDRPAEAPEQLKKRRKDGRSLSIKSPGLTTEEVFRETCARVGDNPDGPEYAEFLENVRTKNTLWRCVLGGTDRARAAAIFDEAIETARQIARAAQAGPTSAPRNWRSHKGATCNRCELYNTCYQSLGTSDLVRRLRNPTATPKPEQMLDLTELDLE